MLHSFCTVILFAAGIGKSSIASHRAELSPMRLRKIIARHASGDHALGRQRQSYFQAHG
jgi:hypothetical protein